MDDAATSQPYGDLTTIGRTSGRARTIEIWFAGHGLTVYLLAGDGDHSHWVRNILADGRATAGHDFRTARNEAGESVGVLWFARTDGPGPITAFIWDIAVHPAFRGRGYGRATLEALEPIARALGCEAIRLHVFGDNDVARNLYLSTGYIETDVSMVKRLG